LPLKRHRINAEDYGRTIYDLSIRRDLIMNRRRYGQHCFTMRRSNATPSSHIEGC